MNRSAFSGNPRLLRLVTGCGNAACAGLHAIALVDIKSGRCLFAASAPTDVAADLDLRRAARHQATILRAQIENGIDLFQSDEEENGGLEDIVLTTRRQYHLISFVPQPDYSGLFLYLIADRSQANLALARRELRETALDLALSPGECEILARLRQTRAGNSRAETPPITNFARSTGFSPPASYDKPIEPRNVEEENLPPFMRTDTVMQLLGIAGDGDSTGADTTP